MIQDYLKSPEYYKLKYIDKVVERKVTDPMKVGLMVDALLTQPQNNPYELKVLKKEDPETYERQKNIEDEYLLSEVYFSKAFQVAQDIDRQPFWNEGLESAQFQYILEGEIESTPVCGLPDRVDQIDEDHWRLSDIKVVNPIKNENRKKWMMNAQEMGYIRQAALYRYLFAHERGVPEENVEFFHIAGAYVGEYLTRIRLYKIEDHLMRIAMEEIISVLRAIKAKQFEPKLITWSMYQ